MAQNALPGVGQTFFLSLANFCCSDAGSDAPHFVAHERMKDARGQRSHDTPSATAEAVAVKLFFRLLHAFLAVRFREPCGMLGPCRTRFRVWPGDIDVLLQVNNGVYLSMLDVARVDIDAALGRARAPAQRTRLPRRPSADDSPIVTGNLACDGQAAVSRNPAYRLRSRAPSELRHAV